MDKKKNERIGASRWMSGKDIEDMVEMHSEEGNNLVLSNTVRLSMDYTKSSRKTTLNNNVFILAEHRTCKENPGLLKLIEANTLSGNGALVFLDHNERYYSMLSGALQKRGYLVQQIDPDNPAATPGQIVDWLLKEPLSAVFIKDPCSAPLSPFDMAKKPEGYLSAGEYMQKIMLGIGKKNEKGEWEKAKNHKVRFFIDFRGDFSGTVPDLGHIICSQMLHCNHVPGGWISIFLIAGTLKDMEKYGSDRELLMGCCDTLIYMGGGHDNVVRELGKGMGKDVDTAKFISARTGKRLTGWDLKVLNAKNKIDALRGVHNRREVPNLISWKKVIDLKGDRCILFVRGMLPILDKAC